MTRRVSQREKTPLSASINPGILPNAATPASHPDRRALLIQIAAVHGLIVDYIGIAQNLKSALSQYSPGDRKEVEMDPGAAEAVLREKYEIVRAMFHGFDYLTALKGTATERLKMMASAIEWVLDLQQSRRSRNHRRAQEAGPASI